MLYVIYGSDAIKVHKKSSDLIQTLLKKKPDASLFKLTTENWSLAELQELIGGQGLFSNKYIVHLSRLLEDESIGDELLKYIKDIHESENIFILTEGKLNAKLLKVLEKNSQKIEEHQEKEIIKKVSFNVFSLADALGSRDKKKMWTLYIEALNNLAPEEIHGTLFWQVKSMIVASKTKNAEESGLKPFVYSKAKRFSENYTKEELQNLSSKLIATVHESRRGKFDFAIALERLILEV